MMEVTFRRLRLFACFALCVIAVSACGGGGSSDDDGSDIGAPLPAQEIALSLIGDATAEVGDSVGAVATLSGGTFSDYQWEQLSGPAVFLAGDRTAGIGFDALEAGNYSFRFTATQTGGGSISDTFTISVSEKIAGPSIRLRLDRAVSEGAQVSLRLDAEGLTYQNSLSWAFRQVSGSRAEQMSEAADEPLLFFTAPRVTGDEVLVFEGIFYVDGERYSDIAYVAVQNRSPATSGYFCDGEGDYCATTSPLAHVYSYRPDSPYREQLAGCVYSNQLIDSSLCTLGQLPLIGMRSSNPDVDLIMDHVLVSHDWMGQRFEEYLLQLDPHDDFKNLLRSTTAIVISHDVRPSFYWALTGAIYLDPESLWLTPQERDVINEQPDYRIGFGSELNFFTPWRYVKDNQYAFSEIPVWLRWERALGEIEADLGSLLYHELAHAADMMPQGKINAGLDSDEIFFLQTAALGEAVQDSVKVLNPLQSQEMFALALVKFRGDSATEEQKSYTPADVAGFFFGDTANDDYSYVADAEDLAMLFEETMMSLRYGIERDIAITNVPDNPQSADDYKLTQGQRNRIGDTAIRPRASRAVEGVLLEAWADADAHLRNLTPIPLCIGEGWNQNLTPACEQSASRLQVTTHRPSALTPMPRQTPRSFMPPLR